MTACSAIGPDYKPHRQSVLLLTEKQQARLGLHASRGIGLHIALAPVDHLGLTFQTNAYGAGELFGDSEGMRMQQFGLGFFSKNDFGLVYEGYLVGGFGRISYYSDSLHGDGSRPLHARTWLAAVQPALGFQHQAFEVALSGRTGYFGHTNVRGQYRHAGLDMARYLRQRPHTLMFEPALTGRMFAKHVGYELQYGRSMSLSRPALRQSGDWASFSVLWRIPGVNLPPGWND